MGDCLTNASYTGVSFLATVYAEATLSGDETSFHADEAPKFHQKELQES